VLTASPCMVQQGIQMAGAWSKKDNEKLTSYITKWLYSKPNYVTMMAKKIYYEFDIHSLAQYG